MIGRITTRDADVKKIMKRLRKESMKEGDSPEILIKTICSHSESFDCDGEMGLSMFEQDLLDGEFLEARLHILIPPDIEIFIPVADSVVAVLYSYVDYIRDAIVFDVLDGDNSTPSKVKREVNGLKLRFIKKRR